MPEFNTPSKGNPVTPSKGDPVTPSTGNPSAPSMGNPVVPNTGSPVTPSTGNPVTPDKGTPVTPDKGTPVTPDKGTPVTPYNPVTGEGDKDAGDSAYVGGSVTRGLGEDSKWFENQNGDDYGSYMKPGSGTVSSLDFSQLANMSAEEQQAFLQQAFASACQQGQISEGARTAVGLDGIGLDITQRTKNGDYDIPLRAVLYAEANSMGLVNKEDGSLNQDRAKELMGKDMNEWSAEDKSSLETILGVNKNVSDYCVAPGMFGFFNKDKGTIASMFDSMDEMKDFAWMKDMQGAILSGSPEAMAGIQAFSTAMNPDSAVKDYNVQLSSSDMLQADKYLELMEAAKQGKLTPEMAEQGFVDMQRQHDMNQKYGWMFSMKDNQNGMENPTNESQSQEKESSHKFFDFENGKFGPFQKQGNGLVIDLPGTNDLHLGATKENQQSGRLFGFVDGSMSTEEQMSAAVKGGLAGYQAGMSKGLKQLPADGEMPNPTTMEYRGQSTTVKGVNTAEAGQRGAEAEAQFGDLLKKEEAAQMAKQMGE